MVRRRWAWRRAAPWLAAATSCVALVVTWGFHTVATAIEARAHPAPGALADLGTHTLHFLMHGEAGPTVVFDAGLPGTHHDWAGIQAALAPHARSLAFDRAGYGWSTRGPRPRTASVMAGELRRLLQVEGIEGPYVLVGHSFGGITMRAFAQRFPRDVAALVLVDATHEDHLQAFPEAYRAQQRRTAAQLRLGALLAPLGLPRLLGVGLLPPGPATAAVRYRNEGFATAHDEFASMDASFAEVRGVSLGDLPLTVVVRGRPHPPIAGMTSDDMAALDEAWSDLQRDLLGLSSDATLVVADGAGHFVHHDRPALLVEVLLAVIRRLEAPTPAGPVRRPRRGGSAAGSAAAAPPGPPA